MQIYHQGNLVNKLKHAKGLSLVYTAVYTNDYVKRMKWRPTSWNRTNKVLFSRSVLAIYFYNDFSAWQPDMSKRKIL